MQARWQSTGQYFEIRYYLGVIARHRGAMCLIVFSIFIISFYLINRLPKIYQVSALIFVPMNQSPVSLTATGDLLKTVPAFHSNKNMMAAYLGILKSETLMLRIANQIPGRSVQAIKRNTRINVYTKRFYFQIFARDRDPDVALKIARVYTDQANGLLQDMSSVPVEASWDNLERRIQETESDLYKAETDLQKFKNQYRLADPAMQKKQLLRERSVFLDTLHESNVRLQEVISNIDIVKERLQAEGKFQLSSESITANPVINHLKTALSSIQIKLALFRSNYSEEHPDVLRLKTEYAQTRTSLKNEVRKIIGTQMKSINPIYENLRQMVVSDLVKQHSLQVRIEALEGIVTELDKRIAEFIDLGIRLADLQRKIMNFDKARNLLKMELEEVKLQQTRVLQTFIILDQAKYPKMPAFPRPLNVAIVVLFFSLFTGLTYAFLAERKKRNNSEKHKMFLPAD